MLTRIAALVCAAGMFLPAGPASATDNRPGPGGGGDGNGGGSGGRNRCIYERPDRLLRPLPVSAGSPRAPAAGTGSGALQRPVVGRLIGQANRLGVGARIAAHVRYAETWQSSGELAEFI
jgi:hypothetical protein